MSRCAAIVGETWRYQIQRQQRCQNAPAHWPNGIGLCGTHFNAAFRGPIHIVTTLELGDDDL